MEKKLSKIGKHIISLAMWLYRKLCHGLIMGFWIIFLNKCIIHPFYQLSPLTMHTLLNNSVIFFHEWILSGARDRGNVILTSVAEIDVFRSEINVCLPIQTKISAPQSNI